MIGTDLLTALGLVIVMLALARPPRSRDGSPHLLDLTHLLRRRRP